MGRFELWRRRRRWAVRVALARCVLSGCVLSGVLTGCEPSTTGGDDPTPDAAPDVATADAMVDAAVDARPDAFERIIDRGPPDGGADGAQPDASIDTGPDAGPIGGETCDGIDEDGDGRVDEGFAVGAPCAVGRGACAAPGVVACADGRARCVGEPGPAGDEVCNGVDDDCDGETDEGQTERACYPGPPGTADAGACRAGRTACVAGAEVCADAVVPVGEACDGADRDCDGRVDEGCAGCGDGRVGPGEGCDDGNRIGGDGCAADCSVEGAGLIAGIQRDVPLDALADRGWRPCHISLYGDGGTPLDEVLAGCGGTHLLIGCARVGDDRLTLAAEGAFDQVTADVGDGEGAVTPHNGVDFYFSRAASWGFAPAGAGVVRNTCDVQDQESPERMCWHTAGDAFRGGWRCGAAVRLNESRDWQRLIFTRAQVALGPSRGFGHHGLCGDFNGCVDAAGCARAACAHFDHGPPVSWREGLCDAEAGLDCDLFDPAPAVLDDAWAPGCAMPVAYDVVCESAR